MNIMSSLKIYLFNYTLTSLDVHKYLINISAAQCTEQNERKKWVNFPLFFQTVGLNINTKPTIDSFPCLFAMISKFVKNFSFADKFSFYFHVSWDAM